LAQFVFESGQRFLTPILPLFPSDFFVCYTGTQATNIPDRLPDAKKRSAYDYSARAQAPPVGTDDDHPLGSSNMNALGEKTLSKMDQLKLARAEEKRTQLHKERYDIISCLEKEANPINSPRARNAAELLIGQPIPGRTDDGILLIGRTAAEEHNVKKAKQAQYMDQLNADSGKKFGLGENYDPAEDSLNTYKSYKRIEKTGTTGYSISSGASIDMTSSMKELDFSVKRKAQEAYRAVLQEQQAHKAEMLASEKAADANIDTNSSYFMRADANSQ
jgi:hypothetical protein